MELQRLLVCRLAPRVRGCQLSETSDPQPNTGEADGLGWRFWALVPPVGIGAGLAAAALMLLLRAIEALAWGEATGDFLDRVRAAAPEHRLLILLGAGLVTAGMRWLLSLRPGGHGGELAEVIWFRAGRLPAWRTLAKAVTSIVIVAMGASLGREAAPKQVGALWAWLLSHWTGLPAPQRRLLSACGAGAGIAAVYNVPIGGALFALEVLLGTISLPLVAPALLTTGLATCTTWLFLPSQPTYHLVVPDISPALLGFALLVGPLMGLAAAAYLRLIAWADQRKPQGTLGLLAPVLVFAALGLLALRLPELLGNGKSEVQAIFTGTLPLWSMLALALLKPLTTAACLGSGAPGGLFTPTITLGAALSGVLERGWQWLLPSTSGGGTGAVLGAGALLAAATAGPVSALVLTLELTGQIGGLVAPLALAVGGAMLTIRRLETRSVYSCRIHLARAVAEQGSGPSLSTADRYTRVLQVLLLDPITPVPVRDEHGVIVGTVDGRDIAARAGRLCPLPITTARDLSRG